MKILVPVKRVVDYNVKVRVKADQTGVDLTHAKMTINPFCEIGVEEALKIKEQGLAEEVVVVSVGNSQAQETLRAALALGADRAILVETDIEMESLNVAKILNALLNKDDYGLVILGKQSIDTDNNQTGQMLAALSGSPQGTFASEVVINADQVQVTREVDGGLETVNLKLPAIITTDLRLNQPRFASLPNIMKAKRKPLEVIAAADLGLSLTQHTEILTVEEPAKREAGIKVDDVDGLLDKLRTEAKVI